MTSEVETALLREYFDPAFYLRRYSDVRFAGADPFEHFLAFGWREGRNPSPDFNTEYYRLCHRQHLRPDENPLLHFVRRGKVQRLRPAPGSLKEFESLQRSWSQRLFDTRFYTKQNPLIRIEEAVSHYFSIGWRQGRDPSPNFSTASYVFDHPHLVASGLNPLFHYDVCGRNLGISASRAALAGPSQAELRRLQGVVEFDADYYVRSNPDVQEAGGDPLRHFIAFGAAENRQPNDRYCIAGVAEDLSDHFLAHASKCKSECFDPAAQRTTFVDIFVLLVDPLDIVRYASDKLIAQRDKSIQLTFICPKVEDPAVRRSIDVLLEKSPGSSIFYFDASVENSFECAVACSSPDKDAVVMDSLCTVYDGWLDRLQSHLGGSDRVATVSPLSNGSTLAGYPHRHRGEINSVSWNPAMLSRAALEANRSLNSKIPIGDARLIYITAEYLRAVRSYGSNGRELSRYDAQAAFCAQASQLGFHHLLAHDVFVFSHSTLASSGGQPITSLPRLVAKHPELAGRMNRYIGVDSSRFARMRLDTMRLRCMTAAPNVLFISHSKGGGIAKNVHELRDALTKQGVDTILWTIRDGCVDIEASIAGQDLRLQGLQEIDVLSNRDDLAWCMRHLEPRVIHVHSVVGLKAAAVMALFNMVREAAVPYVYTWHDHSALCHRDNFVTEEGSYCGEPALDACKICFAVNPSSTDLLPEDRRRSFTSFLSGAHRVIAPSVSALERVTRILPKHSNVHVLQHQERPSIVTWIDSPAEWRPVRIAVLGSMYPHKGADVLYAIAKDAALRNLPLDFYLIGKSARAHLEDFVTVTGEYVGDDDAIARIRNLQPHLALLPSIWPETHLYTLSITLAAGLPTVAFNTGAQAERLSHLTWCRVLELDLVNKPLEINDVLCALPLEKMWDSRERVRTKDPSQDLFRDYYGLVDASSWPDDTASKC